MANRPLYVPKSDRGPADYTAGKTYMTDDGKEYIGLYHTYPKNNVVYSGASFSSKSKKLISYIATIAGPAEEGASKANGVYYNLTRKAFNKHLVPIYHYPRPKKVDYGKAKFVRFLTCKKNQFETVIEIDSKQFSKINKVNKMGLNGDLYTTLELFWTIAGPKEDVKKYNKASIRKASRTIPTIKQYLGDLTEYYK
tara:strand:- start:753 stop:1340 length:588 start_codon:yes stop_codon:yes gene_type:complete